MSREEEAEGVEAAALGAVAGQLMAAREGLRPVGTDVLEAAAAHLSDDAGEGTAPGQSNGMGHGTTALVPLRWLNVCTATAMRKSACESTAAGWRSTALAPA